MSKQKRRHPRIETNIDVELNFLDKPYNLISNSISHGGMFLLCDTPDDFPLGELVSARFSDVLNDNENVTKDAVIIRNTNEGFAIAYVEIEGF